MQVRHLLNATQLSNRNAFIMMAVMMFVIVLSMVLATVAFLPNDELYEDDDFDDFLAMGGWIAGWTIIFTILSFVLNLDLEFLKLAVVAEYLRSHIGEKRFGDWTIELNNSFLIPDSSMTAFNKAVICFSFPRHCQNNVHKLINVLFHLLRSSSPLFWRNNLCLRR